MQCHWPFTMWMWRCHNANIYDWFTHTHTHKAARSNSHWFRHLAKALTSTIIANLSGLGACLWVRFNEYIIKHFLPINQIQILIVCAKITVYLDGLSYVRVCYYWRYSWCCCCCYFSCWCVYCITYICLSHLLACICLENFFRGSNTRETKRNAEFEYTTMNILAHQKQEQCRRVQYTAKHFQWRH